MEMGNKEELRILKNCCDNCADAEFAEVHKIAERKKAGSRTTRLSSETCWLWP